MRKYEDRLNREITWHRQQAASVVSLEPFSTDVIERYHFNRDANIFMKEFAFIRMGKLKGKRVCDFGCGDGENSVLLAKLGATVEAFDLSPELVEGARKRARINHVEEHIAFSISSIEEFTLPENHFDIVFGSNILHHLDVKNMHRLYFEKVNASLTKGGKAIFIEPICFSKALGLMRDHVPIKKNASPDERQLDREDIQIVMKHFSEVEMKFFRLFGRLDRLFINQNKVYETHSFRWRTLRFLNLFDQLFIEYVPIARQLSGNVVLVCSRK